MDPVTIAGLILLSCVCWRVCSVKRAWDKHDSPEECRKRADLNRRLHEIRHPSEHDMARMRCEASIQKHLQEAQQRDEKNHAITKYYQSSSENADKMLGVYGAWYDRRERVYRLADGIVIDDRSVGCGHFGALAILAVAEIAKQHANGREVVFPLQEPHHNDYTHELYRVYFLKKRAEYEAMQTPLTSHKIGG